MRSDYSTCDPIIVCRHTLELRAHLPSGYTRQGAACGRASSRGQFEGREAKKGKARLTARSCLRASLLSLACLAQCLMSAPADADNALSSASTESKVTMSETGVGEEATELRSIAITNDVVGGPACGFSACVPDLASLFLSLLYFL